MNQLTQLGATVNEAISLALQKLGKTREEVDVEVLQEGKKGFLGFGARDAQVRVTVKEVKVEEIAPVVEELVEPVQQQAHEPIIEDDTHGEEPVQIVDEDQPEVQDIDPLEEARTYLTNIALAMGITDLTIHTELHGKNVSFKLESKKAAFLIGKRGQTLNGLQQLTQLIVNKSVKSFMLVRLDVEDYRERRKVSLEQLAERMADKAIRTRKTVKFEPMPSSERKIIHNALAHRLDIETYSEGVEPNRYLVIEPL